MTTLTLADVLKTSSARLKLSDGSNDSTLLDVQILLAHVLKVNRSYFYTWPEKVIDSAQLSQFEALIARRINGEPIAYIIGEQEFWSLPFKVSPATLIPRADTEILVEAVLEHINTPHAKGIDLGTGTGAIALSLAHEMPQWSLLGIDYSHDAVALAEENKQALAIKNSQFIQSSWLDNVDASWLGQCDFIVSNPPYIDENDPHLLQGDVRFEPASALIADNNGLQDYIDIMITAKPFLKAEGYLLFEHGFEQGPAVTSLFLSHGYSHISTVVDLAGNDRVTFAQFL